MYMLLYFRESDGCLVGINLDRPLSEGEFVVNYEGEVPPEGMTFRYDFVTNTVLVVPVIECPQDSTGDESTGEDDLLEPVSPIYAEVWPSEDTVIPAKGVFGINFDQKNDPNSLLILHENVVEIPGGTYYIWGGVTAGVYRSYAAACIIANLAINEEVIKVYEVGIYFRSRFCWSIGPIAIDLPNERNFVGIFMEYRHKMYSVAYDRSYCLKNTPCVLVGGKENTYLFLQKIG